MLIVANVYPEEPLIDTTDWKKIKGFIIHEAPEKLSNRPLELEVKGVFNPASPKVHISPPMATMIKYEGSSG